LPKLVSASIVGSEGGTTGEKKDAILVGEPTEVRISLNGQPARALLDTGSVVSIISETHYNQHHTKTSLKPVGDILNIECADGKSLPYLGYIEIEMTVQQGLPNSTPLSYLLLVTPDTRYSAKTPVIIGTNILQDLMKECKEKHGDQFLQRANLHFPWYQSFRAITIRERELKRHKNRLAILRCATADKIVLKPNQSKNSIGFTDQKLHHPSTLAIVHETTDSTIPATVDISPAIVRYDSSKGHQPVKITCPTLLLVLLSSLQAQLSANYIQ